MQAVEKNPNITPANTLFFLFIDHSLFLSSDVTMP